MLILSFCLATTALFLQSVCFSGIPINPYAPWIALVSLNDPLQKDFWKPLWLSAASGFAADLLSDHPLGLYPIAYTITATLLLRLRKPFSKKHPLHLGLFTSLASLIASIFQIFFLFLFDRGIHFSTSEVVLQLAGTSIFDGIYAVVWFAGPLYAIAKVRQLYPGGIPSPFSLFNSNS